MWIKTEDRKPPKNNPFIGFGKDSLGEEEEILVMIWYKGGLDHDEYNMDEGYYALGQWGIYEREHSCNPSHWMPLPNPPNK